MTTPTKEGFYWGKWLLRDDGTQDIESEGDVVHMPEWEVMHVVENTADTSHPEYLKAMVPGVSKWQSIENFSWSDLAALEVPA